MIVIPLAEEGETAFFGRRDFRRRSCRWKKLAFCSRH
jgi:hypothetical protein